MRNGYLRPPRPQRRRQPSRRILVLHTHLRLIPRGRDGDDPSQHLDRKDPEYERDNGLCHRSRMVWLPHRSVAKGTRIRCHRVREEYSNSFGGVGQQPISVTYGLPLPSTSQYPHSNPRRFYPVHISVSEIQPRGSEQLLRRFLERKPYGFRDLPPYHGVVGT